MVTELLAVLGTALRIWEHEKKGELSEEVHELEKRWNEEWNKPVAVRSDAVLDNVRVQLELLARRFVRLAAESGQPNAQAKSGPAGL